MQQTSEQLVTRNPATGEVLATLNCTPVSELTHLFERAKAAQEKWALLSRSTRSKYLLDLRETLIQRVDEISELISKENGKPKIEALSAELFPSVDMLTYFAKHARVVLEDQPLKLTLMKHRKSYLNYWPLGVVAVISPWNYPFMLPFGQILMALVAGNAVVFKPSEITPLVGLMIKELCDQSGFPKDLIQVVIGDGSVGAAVVEQRPAKIFFTGSVATGKKIMSAAAKHLIPVNLELGGKDAMIVLADADLDFATSAALWGAFTNSGQVCASVERLLVDRSISENFSLLLKAKMAQLRQGPSSTSANDLGPITFEKQKDVYQRHIQQAKDSNAQFIAGGEFIDSDRRYLKPTLVTGEGIESLDIYNEESFGPIAALTTFTSVEEAIEKANRSPYGLLASVITRNHSLGEQIARRLEVGTVIINEVAYTAGLGETPWGGVKESGFGRSHSLMGLMEFVNVRHIHKPRSHLFVFKSLWWFPYSAFQYETFRSLLALYKRSWFEKAKALPIFLWNLIHFLKNEKRL